MYFSSEQAIFIVPSLAESKTPSRIFRTDQNKKSKINISNYQSPQARPSSQSLKHHPHRQPAIPSKTLRSSQTSSISTTTALGPYTGYLVLPHPQYISHYPPPRRVFHCFRRIDPAIQAQDAHTIPCDACDRTCVASENGLASLAYRVLRLVSRGKGYEVVRGA
jgi:hypothetical protein